MILKGELKVKYKTLLSLDGGGIRGLMSARILQELEGRTDKSIHELFDLIVGASTGGILATCLARPRRGPANGPCAAEELVQLYSKRGERIFSRSFWKGLSSLWGLSDEKYDAKPLEGILTEMLGDAELKDTVPDIVVPSYDIERRKPYLFKTSKARDGKRNRNHLLRHVARATSAAPTFFEALLLDHKKWKGEKGKQRALIDGGLLASNPSMIAVSEAVSSGADLSEILLCSIGTGIHDRKIPRKEAKDWGPVGWAGPTISVMLDGMSDLAHYHARQLLPNTNVEAEEQRYFRFDIRLKHALDDLDAAHRANIIALLGEADRIIENQGDELDRLVETLVQRAAV